MYMGTESDIKYIVQGHITQFIIALNQNNVNQHRISKE